MLRITALVKYVPEATDRRFADDLTLDRAGTPGRLSELDEHTAEQAIRLAEARRAAGGEAEVTYLTMGPSAASEALRKALAMGGDRAVHVLDPALHGSDAHATSLTLAAAIERIGFDLVVCGMASTDAGLGLIPAMLAERLAVPHVSLATSLSLDGGRVSIERVVLGLIAAVIITLLLYRGAQQNTGKPLSPKQLILDLRSGPP